MTRELDNKYYKLWDESDDVFKCYSDLVNYDNPMNDSYELERMKCMTIMKELNDKKDKFMRDVQFLREMTNPNLPVRPAATMLYIEDRQEIWDWITNVYDRHPFTIY